MGEPITLVKGSETMTVYGLAQAAVHVADGWQAVDANTAASLPEVKPEPVTEPKQPTAVTKRGKAKQD